VSVYKLFECPLYKLSRGVNTEILPHSKKMYSYTNKHILLANSILKLK